MHWAAFTHALFVLAMEKQRPYAIPEDYRLLIPEAAAVIANEPKADF